MKLPLLAYKCCCVEERDALLRELKEKGVPVWEGSLPETAGIEYRVEPDFLFVKVGRTFGNSQRMLLRGAVAPYAEVVSTRQEFVQRLVDASRTAESRETNRTEGHFPSPPFKLRVSSNEEWEAVQKELFKQGYKWPSGRQTVYRRRLGDYVFVDASGFITYGQTYSYFKDHQYPEVVLRLPPASPKTYKLGSRWRLTNTTYKGHEYILAGCPGAFSLVDLSTGETWNIITNTYSKELDEEQWKELCAQGTFEPIP